MATNASRNCVSEVAHGARAFRHLLRSRPPPLALFAQQDCRVHVVASYIRRRERCATSRRTTTDRVTDGRFEKQRSRPERDSSFARPRWLWSKTRAISAGCCRTYGHPGEPSTECMLWAYPIGRTRTTSRCSSGSTSTSPEFSRTIERLTKQTPVSSPHHCRLRPNELFP
jgi:hypothetical protein